MLCPLPPLPKRYAWAHQPYSMHCACSPTTCLQAGRSWSSRCLRGRKSHLAPHPFSAPFKGQCYHQLLASHGNALMPYRSWHMHACTHAGTPAMPFRPPALRRTSWTCTIPRSSCFSSARMPSTTGPMCGSDPWPAHTRWRTLTRLWTCPPLKTGSPWVGVS